MGDFLKKEYPLKVVAIFDAVVELINDGVDINLLKVADITKRAGIGKGTAYEYFTSKEEIIAGALIYDVKVTFSNLYLLLQIEETFEEKMRAVLKWIKDDFKKSHVFTRIVTMGSQSRKINCCLKEHLEVSRQAYDEYLSFINHLLEIGISQRTIQEKNKFRSQMAISSQIVSLVMFLTNPEMYPGATEQEAMETAYDNIMLLIKNNGT
jgi:AcrR family transcriptional regulator